jgi:DNA polymerase-4
MVGGGTTVARTIIHVDLDAFFCAVEELRDPALVGRAFAVGGSPESRGVVASCSYPARRFGVHSAMPMSQAVRVCPGLLVVEPNFRDYRRVSRQVMARLRRLTPLVEQLSIDEAFLDVSARSESALELAQSLQSMIRGELKVPVSLGVAPNKLVAKIANNVGKAGATGDGPPNAIRVVPSGEEAAFLAPLPCGELWGVGPKTAARLAELGLRTIGDMAQQPPQTLERLFGKNGRDLALRAQGLDDRTVETEQERKSISQETTFSRDVADMAKLHATLRGLAEGVSHDLRRQQVKGSTVKLKLRWSDFTTPTRQLTLAQPTDDAQQIYAAALQLFQRLWIPGRPVRLLGVGVSGLGDLPRQMSLWDRPNEKQERLQAAVDRLRARFGEQAIRRASDLPEPGDES